MMCIGAIRHVKPHQYYQINFILEYFILFALEKLLDVQFKY